MSDPFSLQGKTALITGGTRGLGRALSLCFARAGATVLANYVRDTRAAESLAAEAAQEGLSLATIRADLTAPKGMDSLVAATESTLGQLSCLVHCAATGVHKPLGELDLRHLDWTFNLNVRACFELVRRLLPIMPAGSAILGVSSEGAHRAALQYTLVGSSKGALEALMRHMAVELAPRGVRVNVISPGPLHTDVWKVLPDSTQRLETAARRSPLGRLVSVDEVARVAQFLCSEAASGIVGQTVVVDGGGGVVAQG
ncbi:MAG: SDR family NAD(P)-dependent oxidoreductase [Verrucomicrobiales bacterium]